MDQPQCVMAWLAVTAGPQKGMTYQLKIGDNTIGREGCDLVIEDTAVSRRHAMIKVQGASFLLIDTGSLGGKIVNPGSVISLAGFAPKVNLRLMVRQAHHERKYENPFALSLSKGDLAKQGTFGAKLVWGRPGSHSWRWRAQSHRNSPCPYPAKPSSSSLTAPVVVFSSHSQGRMRAEALRLPRETT